MIQALIALVSALPELMKLVKVLQLNADASFENKKVKDDIKVIRKAFEDGDEQALKDLFNNKLDDDEWVSHVG